jgi:tetratricopeptide (TPR) repeat protein
VEAPADQVKIAAAALIVMGGAARHAVPALEAARAKAEDETAAWLDLLLAIAGLGDDWKRVLDRTEKLASSSLYPDEVFRTRLAALRSLRRYEEAEKLAAARLEKSPDDTGAQEWLLTLAVDRGDFAGAEKLAKKLIDSGKASNTIYNNAAWYALFRPGSLEEAIKRAEHAVSQQKFQNRFANNTLAALYAEVGRAAEARPLALRAVDQEPNQEPNDAYWYVFGRIAEGYGLIDVARASYQRVKTPEDAGPDHSSHLAKRRLAALPPP